MEGNLQVFVLIWLAMIFMFFNQPVQSKPGYVKGNHRNTNDATLYWKKQPASHKSTINHKNDLKHHFRTHSGANFDLSINLLTGNYNISVNEKLWLQNSPIFLVMGGKKYSTDDGSLKLVGTKEDFGDDILGHFDRYNLHFQPISQTINVTFSFKLYQGIDTPYFVFEQTFPEELAVAGTTKERNTVCTGFPSFKMDHSAGLGYLAFGGIMVAETHRHIGKWGVDKKMSSGLDSGPLVLFNKKQDALIISPLREFMAASVQYETTNMTASWGLLGSAKTVPRHFSYATIIYVSMTGVRKGMGNWGRLMRKYYNRDESFRYSDLTNNYLGYWTDNGAFYYYNTEPNKTYEQTLLHVTAYANKLNIPYRYIQYDSWWYYKGKDDGVTDWTSMPEVFPDGLFGVYNKTGLPVLAHNRWWSSKNVYAKQNGGKYNFIIEENHKKAIPIDQNFWDDLMQNSKKWGLINYEQDWLNMEFDYLDITVTDLTIGREWLMQMGKGAAKNGITIQYCMAPSRAALQALEIPVVSQARVSADYHPGKDDWKIGISSMLADALGMAPLKDNFWTTTNQKGNPYNASETHPALHALSATLSTGPVGPSDKVGASDPQLIMRSCNADGLILKPSMPIFAIDAQIHEAAFHDGSGPSGEVYTTQSVISGYHFGVIMAADMKKTNSYNITPSSSGITVQENSVVFPYDQEVASFQRFSETNPLNLKGCTKDEFCLYYITPVIDLLDDSSVIIYGELSKWVPMSPQRVTYIGVGSNDLHLHIAGAVGEMVTLTFGDPESKSSVRLSCRINNDGTAKMRVKSRKCI